MHVDICIVHKLYVHIDISADPCCSGGVRERSNFCQAIRKDMLGLKLASKQFRKQRLALWAAARGPDPSFTAIVFFCAAAPSLDPSCARRKPPADAASNLEAGSAERQVKARFEATF